MQVPFVDLKKQYLSIQSHVDQAMADVFDQTAFIGGKFPAKFEKEYAQKYGTKHCIAVANGTDALYITLKMLGIGKGDEVITTACSWISTSETISQTGATPIFVDIDEYFLIDTSKIEAKITSKTKAILPVHLYGQMADITTIQTLCNKHKLQLIEDCAQAHFAELDGQKAGITGTAGTFSFYPAKNLGAYGDAGCIITNDDKLALQCRKFANHGGVTQHDHDTEGINSRMDGLQASILSVKLPFLDQWTVKRQENAQLYSDLLKEVKEIKLPKIKENATHVFHLFIIETQQREELQQHLAQHEVGTAIHYPTPLPFLKCYQHLGAKKEDFPQALHKQNQILSLPIYPELTTQQIEFVCQLIKDFFTQKTS